MSVGMEGEDEWLAWIGRAPSLAKVTPEALAKALDGFRLGGPKAGLNWLSRAVQGALLFTVPVLREIQSPVTNECCVVTIPNDTQARQIYRKLSKSADALLALLIRNRELLAHDLPEQFGSLIGEVERAAEAFTEAAESGSRLPSRWRDARLRADRVERATILSPIFEIAYGREPTVNTYPGSDGGPWPDFYQRIVGLVFGDLEINDRDAVLKEARKADRLARVTFADGIIPEYPL